MIGKVLALTWVAGATWAFVIVNSAEFPHHQVPPLKPITPATPTVIYQPLPTPKAPAPTTTPTVKPDWDHFQVV